MLEDKKIYERPQRQLWEKEIEGSSNDIVFEFFQTKDKECIYSKGYPGGINFEFYPNKKKLNIIRYPSITSKFELEYILFILMYGELLTTSSYDFNINDFKFDNKSKILRHRMINKCLQDDFQSDLHSVSIKAYTIDEYKTIN